MEPGNKKDLRSHLVTHLPKLRFNPVLTIIGAVLIYFLAQIVAVNILAIAGVTQGWSIEQFEAWLQGSLVAKFTLRLVIAVVGIGLVYWVLRLFKSSWSAIGLKRPKIVKDISYALVGYGWYFIFHLLATFIIVRILPTVDLSQRQQLGFSTDASGAALVVIFVSLVVLPPLYEEILTRGFLFTGLRFKLSLPVAAIITSLLFGVAHLEFGSNAPLLWIAGIDTFILSMVLVYLRESTGSLWPAIWLHAIKNGAAFLLLFVFKVQYGV